MLLTGCFTFVVSRPFEDGAMMLVKPLEFHVTCVDFLILQHVPVFRIRWNRSGIGGKAIFFILEIKDLVRLVNMGQVSEQQSCHWQVGRIDWNQTFAHLFALHRSPCPIQWCVWRLSEQRLCPTPLESSTLQHHCRLGGRFRVGLFVGHVCFPFILVQNSVEEIAVQPFQNTDCVAPNSFDT